MDRWRLLLVDDHALFRVGIRSVLEQEDDVEVVGEAADGRSAFDAVVETSPDIILMDLLLSAPCGIEATQRIKRELPACGIIVLAVDEDEDALFEAIKAGAAAFILKDVGPDDLVTIIRRGSRSASTSSTTRSSRSRPSPAACSRSSASWPSTGRRPPRFSRRSPRARCRSWITSPRA